jgi:hypothetical protein
MLKVASELGSKERTEAKRRGNVMMLALRDRKAHWACRKQGFWSSAYREAVPTLHTFYLIAFFVREDMIIRLNMAFENRTQQKSIVKWFTPDVCVDCPFVSRLPGQAPTLPCYHPQLT